MAEELYIRTTITGQPQLNELIKKFNEGNATIGEMITLRKALEKVRLETIAGTNSEIAISKALVSVKEKIAETSNRVMTAHGKMMQEYFRSGLALRQFLLQNQHVIQSLFDASSGAGAFVTQLSNIVFQANLVSKSLRYAGLATGVYAAGIGTIVASIPVLVSLFQKSDDAAKKSADSIRQWAQELGKLTVFEVQREVAVLEERVKQAKNAVERRKKQIEEQRTARAGALSLEGVPVEVKDEALELLQAKLLEAQKQLEEKRLDLHRQTNERLEQMTLEIEKKKVELSDKYEFEKQKKILDLQLQYDKTQAERTIQDKVLLNSVLLKLEERYQVEKQLLAKKYAEPSERPELLALPQRTPSEALFLSTPKLKEVRVKSVEPFRKLTEESERAMEKIQSLQQTAVFSMASAITSTLAGAWDDMFGRAETRLAQFAKRMLQILAELALKIAAFKLFQAILGGGTPSPVPMPVSGGLPVGRVAGSPMVGGNLVASQRMVGAVNNLANREWKLKGTDLYLAYNINARVVGERVIGVS